MENLFSSSSSEALIETLIQRGWSFIDLEHVRALIIIQSALQEDPCTVDLIESHLVNMDFRSIGGKSLPEPPVLRKSSHIQGPKVLQVSSLKDISRNSVTDSAGNVHDHRLLRLSLTDGHSQMTAIEYSHIPSLDDVVPGTKVRLENKAPVNNGIVCLSPKLITVLGGVVQSLYEEWQMNKKYSEISRSFLRASKIGETDGPPPFEKLQTRPPQQHSRQDKYPLSTSRPYQKTSAPEKWAKPDSRHIPPAIHSTEHIDDGKSAFNAGRLEEKPSSSDTRQKEVVESIPVQNQAAAQKLLQKMNQSSHENRNYRGRRRGGRERHDDLPVFTLDEWERKKDVGQTSRREDFPSASIDEDFARQLQMQYDLEDSHNFQEQRGPPIVNSQADNIKLMMFNYDRNDRAYEGEGFRGRGRGRGRGGRGRGGRGRGR
ncbi:tudor domain-containing protein 3 isoform X2 [Impatiens glandulifera]|uniref:tudor domain-containing protein 3 isoform X2 n=1 Tax=Impatiens glandulifera TaxID=253017 RepID=UPI001FB1899B|nr:tudor domain-containing protein 3 isoform X2 [Impatiens glandulifera]